MSNLSLDSNAYTGLFKGDDQIKKIIEKGTTIYVSAIVAGELLAAFKKGSNRAENKRLFEVFLQREPISFVGVGMETAEIYSEIKHQLDKKGTPIPLNDIWIAASAIETGSVLVSYDRHFYNTPGLRLWRGQ